MKARVLVSILSPVFAVLIIISGCATTPHAQHAQEEDMTRHFSVSLAKLYEVSIEACKDLGAKIVMSEIGEDMGMIEANQAIGDRIYQIYLFKNDNDSVKVVVLSGIRTGNVVIADDKHKSDFDKFWEALEAHL